MIEQIIILIATIYIVLVLVVLLIHGLSGLLDLLIGTIELMVLFVSMTFNYLSDWLKSFNQ